MGLELFSRTPTIAQASKLDPKESIAYSMRRKIQQSERNKRGINFLKTNTGSTLPLQDKSTNKYPTQNKEDLKMSQVIQNHRISSKLKHLNNKGLKSLSIKSPLSR